MSGVKLPRECFNAIEDCAVLLSDTAIVRVEERAPPRLALSAPTPGLVTSNREGQAPPPLRHGHFTYPWYQVCTTILPAETTTAGSKTYGARAALEAERK